MERKSKSQWDFGELFPPQPAASPRTVLSVTDLTARVRRLLEQQVGSVWVSGEITNLRAQSSGHIYFTLKDPGAQLSCVLFRGESVSHRELLRDGQKLLLRGDITVYETRGQYQLIVRDVELMGVGALQMAFEKLKQKLQAEGLFAPDRKRPLPKYPQRIGLVTSPTGAAMRDVLHVVRRRHAGLAIVLAPCRVQGEGAAQEIAEAIRRLNQFSAQLEAAPAAAAVLQATRQPLELILVTRGGGSLEDLWAFNEEIVARAIFESGLPVVSAVGHEIDFTISDFVADVRAATPSAAAEIITEGMFSSCQFVAQSRARLGQLGSRQLASKREALRNAARQLARVHPRRRVNEGMQRLDDISTNLQRCARQGLRRQRLGWLQLVARLDRVRPWHIVRRRQETLNASARSLREIARRSLDERRGRLTLLDARLRLLGPEQVLARGYSITTDAATGKVLRNADEVSSGQKLRSRLKTGHVFSRAEPRQR